MANKITEDELVARVDQELRSAQDYMGGKLSNDRRKALSYYMGKAEGDLSPPEIEGRSTYVSTDVAETVEWILPSLLRIFTSSDRVVQCTPRKPGMEQTAQDATDYLNWIFNTQNNGFQSIYTMFKDALISKSGVLKIWWDDKIDEGREEYRGLSDNELTQLIDDEEVEAIEHETRQDEETAKGRAKEVEQVTQQLQRAMMAAQQGDPQAQQAVPQLQQQLAQMQAAPPVMLHDVTVIRRKKSAQVRIDPVPPEEFFVSRNAKTISTAPFVAHLLERSVSDLRADGYKIEDDELPMGDDALGTSQERVQRWSYDDLTAPYASDPSNDPSVRRVWVCEAYLRADVDGDGIAEWRRVLKVGSRVLDNVECDGPPFVMVTPIPMPHRLIGLSVADLAMPIQYHKTAMIRAMQDNVYLQVNGRYFAVNGQVNLDDLLTSRPGGVVRVNAPGAVGPLSQGMADMGSSYQLLEFMEVQKESRTGFSRQSQGLNADVLDRTATEAQIVTNRADMRTELIARVFAETGVKDLFVMILKLVCQYQDEKSQFNLNGRWLEVNPREWRNQFDIVVNVGLGTNDPGQKVSQMGALMTLQEKLVGSGMGLVSPAEVYNASTEMIKALGYKDADRFVKNPQGSPPTPQQEDPKLQIEKLKMQDAAQRFQAEQAAKQSEVQADMQKEQFKQEMQARQIQQQNEIQAQRDLHKAQLDSEAERQKQLIDTAMAEQQLAFDRWKAELDASVRIAVAQISVASRGGPEEVPDGADDGEGVKASDALLTIQQLLMQQAAPKIVIRDENGRITGIRQ